MEKCKICDNGDLEEKLSYRLMRSEGWRPTWIYMKYSKCGWCGCEQTSPEQAAYNKRQVMLERRGVA